MTPLLQILAWTLVLALVQIFLPAGARTLQYGMKWNASARDEAMPAPNKYAGRLARAQANLFETLPLFIGAVLIVHVSGVNSSLSLLGAQLYLGARILYVPLYAFGVPFLRGAAFLVCFAGLGMILFPLLAA
jgi:uncharacterized MAPEG superfamily protein